MLILPSSHRQERIPAGLTSLSEQELLRIIKDSLTPAGLHIHAVQHRLKVAHRVGLAGLARVNLALFSHQLRYEPRVNPGLLRQADDIFSRHIGRIETAASLLGFLDLLLDDRTQDTKDMLRVVYGLRAQHIDGVPSSVLGGVIALRKCATDVLYELTVSSRGRIHSRNTGRGRNQRLIRCVKQFKDTAVDGLELRVATQGILVSPGGVLRVYRPRPSHSPGL